MKRSQRITSDFVAVYLQPYQVSHHLHAVKADDRDNRAHLLFLLGLGFYLLLLVDFFLVQRKHLFPEEPDDLF